MKASDVTFVPTPNLETLLKQGEGDTLEFKKSVAELDVALRTAASFASQYGGTLLFGVSPNGKVVGQPVGADTLERIAQAIRAKIDPPIIPRILVHTTHGGRTVCSVTVEPDGKIHAADGRYYVRVGRTTQLLSPEEVRRRLLGERGFSRSLDRHGRAADILRRLARQETTVADAALEALQLAREADDGAVEWLKWEVSGYRHAQDPSKVEIELPSYRKLTVYASKVFPDQLGLWRSLPQALAARPDLFVLQFLGYREPLSSIEASLLNREPGGFFVHWLKNDQEVATGRHDANYTLYIMTNELVDLVASARQRIIDWLLALT